jgi:hypothetical protein
MPAVQRGASCVGTATEPYISAESVTRCALLRHSLLCLVLSLIFLEKPLLDILAAPQLLGLFKIVVGRLPELLLCKRITRCSRTRVEVVRHFAKFGDRRHASISFRPTCFGATPQNPDWVAILRLCPPGNLSKIAHTPTFPRCVVFSE